MWTRVHALPRTLLAVVGLALATTSTAADPAALKPFVESYAQIAYLTYSDAHTQAQRLETAVDAFLAAPSAGTLAQARSAWLNARVPYGQSECFRFYGGPIDGVDAAGVEGPETRLNAWPLNEAHIDYVAGDASAGLIQKTDLPLNRKSLLDNNMTHDESDVATGYHAVEFLLWGQDPGLESAGVRPASDFLPGDAVRDRRRLYLQLTTSMIVADLAALKAAWAPATADNYRASFVAQDPVVATGHILSGLATLSGFELASERMATALDSGDPEDEQSCFSDNTHHDIIYNALGVRNVCIGTYGTYTGTGLLAVLAATDPALATSLAAQLDATDAAVGNVPVPFDAMLASPEDSPERARAQVAILALIAQADALKAAGAALGADVIVAAE